MAEETPPPTTPPSVPPPPPPSPEPEPQKGSKPPPKCKAILIAEKVIVDAKDGRVSVIGIIDKLLMPNFPVKTRPLWAFLLLTDGVGRYDVVIEIHDLQQDKIIGRGMGIAIHFPERLYKMNVIIPLPALTLTHPGAYDFVVIANGSEIDRQKFSAELPPKGPQDVQPSE